MLDLTDKLDSSIVFPTKALAMYLDLQDGPTDTLVYAAVQKHNDNDEVLYKIIEVVYIVLQKGDFKVGQLNRFGEYLVKCSSAADADRLHEKVKVCVKSVIGFRKMKHIHIEDFNADLVQRKIQDANPDEYKLHKEPGYWTKEMKKVLGKDVAEAGLLRSARCDFL